MTLSKILSMTLSGFSKYIEANLSFILRTATLLILVKALSHFSFVYKVVKPRRQLVANSSSSFVSETSFETTALATSWICARC